MQNKFFKEIRRVLVHIRWPLQSFALFGFLFTIFVLNLQISLPLFLWFVSWTCLWIGATLFDSYYDKDEKPVAGLAEPPKVTKSLLYGAWIFKLIGFLITLQMQEIFRVIYLAGVLGSVIYSHKHSRLKNRKYFSLATNFGIGIITFWSISLFSYPKVSIFIFGALTMGLFQSAMDLLMRIHQIKEDKARKEKSLPVIFGKKRTLTISLILFTTAGVCGLTTFIKAKIPLAYIIISIIYFAAIIVSVWKWRSKKQNSKEDFKTMEKITISSSYIANTVLVIFYILRIKGVM